MMTKPYITDLHINMLNKICSSWLKQDKVSRLFIDANYSKGHLFWTGKLGLRYTLLLAPY